MFKVLHIEKSKFFIKSLKDIMNDLGHEIVEAYTIDDAFVMLENNEIDLIITALSENEEIFVKLSQSIYEDLPILVLTSTDDIITRERLFNLGISDYILKNQITEKRLNLYFESLKKSRGFDLKGRQLEIAVLDDDFFSLRVIRKILTKSSFTNITYFSNPYDLLQSKKKYDIYLIDLVLPEITGEDVMLELRSTNPHAVIIIISSISNNKTVSNILLHGADDFINKPFDRHTFIARITTHLRTYYLRQDLEEKNLLLERMAYTDGLTGLYNHKFIMGRLEEEYDRALRYNHGLSVAMIDIDYFKKVNDGFGHPIGDEILIEVSEILKNNVRQSDIVGRYGGEEFLIIFPECDHDEVLHAVEHIRCKIEDYRFPYVEKLTISGGICNFTGQSTSELISTADANLYKAKNAGRNTIC